MNTSSIETWCMGYCFASATRKLDSTNPQDYVRSGFLLYRIVNLSNLDPYEATANK